MIAFSILSDCQETNIEPGEVDQDNEISTAFVTRNDDLDYRSTSNKKRSFQLKRDGWKT
jgi:hypothetical protein